MAFLVTLVCVLVACGRQANSTQPNGSAGQSSETDSQQAMSDTEIINSAVDNFMLLAEVPRPSHHEEMISAFLMGWAEEQGLSPVQDASLNV